MTRNQRRARELTTATTAVPHHHCIKHTLKRTYNTAGDGKYCVSSIVIVVRILSKIFSL